MLGVDVRTGGKVGRQYDTNRRGVAKEGTQYVIVG